MACENADYRNQTETGARAFRIKKSVETLRSVLQVDLTGGDEFLLAQVEVLDAEDGTEGV